MKTIFKNCVLNFQEKLSEVLITPDFTGDYAPGLGYYFNNSGIITSNESYVGKETGISKEITINRDYAKIKMSGLYQNQYISILVFYDSNGSRIDKVVPKYEGYNNNQALPDIEVSIPSNAVKMRFAIDTASQGTKLADYSAYYVL